jgi:hypothetical protein
MQFEPEFPKSWYYWTKEWKAAANSHIHRQGLIMTGFDTSTMWSNTNHRGEPICFYLELADGWNNGFNSMADDDVTINRKELSRLALSVLLEKALCNTAPVYRPPSWADQLDQDGVVDKLLWFFRSDGQSTLIANLGTVDSSPRIQALRRFLKDFVDYLWLGRSTHALYPYTNFQSFRPQLIAILAGTYRLKILLDPKYTLDEPCWEELRRLAFSEHQDTEPVSLEQAWFEAKSQSVKDAAYVLILRGIDHDQQARADERQALELRMRETRTRPRQI